MRIRKASIRMPIVIAKPIDLTIGSSGRMNPANTLIMISAGGRDDAGGVLEAVVHGVPRVGAVDVGFAHP